MKNQISLAALLVLLLSGCQKPTEVQIVEDALLEVEQVIEPDSSVGRPATDSTGILPKDQTKFAGLFMVTSVKSDYGNGVTSNITAYAALENRTVVFIDSLGRKHFYAHPLGIVRVNNELMLSHERFFGGQSAGFEYVRNVAFNPRGRYVFTGSGTVTGVGAFSVAVDAPENLTVYAPVSGTRVRRGHGLDLHWSALGDNIALIISAVRPQLGNIRSVPVLCLKPKRNLGKAVLGRKILDALPRGVYVFTFVVFNRDERQVISRYPAKVLIQAASLYNVRVDLI
jgi:hypothetical protein